MMRSQDILKGPEWANVRSLYKASGFTDGELEKPLIAVVNSFNSICPGHMNLSQLTQKVKEGIYASGGTPLEFGTIGACDGMAMGHKGMQYVLPTREMIASDIEAMIEAHRLDGLVIVGSCDKIVPGMVLGALRVNLPTVFINGGPALPGRMKAGNPYGGEYIDHSIIQQSEGALKSGEITQEMFDWVENNAVPTIGSCGMLGTANTMTCLVEAMGLSLPGSSTIPAVYSRRLQAAFESGRAVMGMVEKGTRALDIVSKSSIENAIRVNAAIGGSTNAVLHLLAIATEAGIPLDIFELGRISREVPHLIPMIPAGSATLLDFHESGGVPEIMKALRTQLDLTGPTVSGRSWEETLERLPSPAETIVRSLEDPVHKRGGIAILRGNIAPDGAVTKPSAIPEDALVFTGPAKVYEKEEEALRGIRAGEVNPGEVVVIRNEGPKGGPGMPEMYKAMKLLVGMKLGSRVCLITDGRFSGSNNGCFVGHICPEALDDGPIAYLKDGDIIHVDIANGLIEVKDVDLEERRRTMERRVAEPVRGYLYQYRKNVLSASMGAVIPTRE
jgi:dihydroxy-acid dehydratase